MLVDSLDEADEEMMRSIHKCEEEKKVTVDVAQYETRRDYYVFVNDMCMRASMCNTVRIGYRY